MLLQNKEVLLPLFTIGIWDNGEIMKIEVWNVNF